MNWTKHTSVSGQYYLDMTYNSESIYLIPLGVFECLQPVASSLCRILVDAGKWTKHVS